MNIPLGVQEPVLAHEQLCQQQFKQMLHWFLVIVVLTLVVGYVDTEVLALAEVPVKFLFLAMMLCSPLLIVLTFKVWRYFKAKGQLTAYQYMLEKLGRARFESSIKIIQGTISEAVALETTNHLITRLLEYYQPILQSHMTALNQKSLMSALNNETALLKLSCDRKINEIARQVPLIKAMNHIETSLAFLTKRRKEMTVQWEEAYEGFSWWNQIKFATGPDFSEIDDAINELSVLKRRLVAKHEEDFDQLDNHFEQLKEKALLRISSAKIEAERFIQEASYQDDFGATILHKAMWFSAMSLPVSIWSDVDRAMDVYDALRGVSGNFAGMSDAEIWLESLFLPAESLAGLTALTKGAYFEQLVADDTGGQLFEHFNNPDTDIVIDGVAFQLKATGSEAYIYSVDESVPVIATTEVAQTTGVLDSGYSNEELTNTVDNALGGTIVDIGDTTADSILAGLGGLGFFATIDGINHAATKYENGGDAVEAMFEGAGVAIEGTARALVGAAEMGYKVLASRPSRFIGRTLLSGLEKLDQKLFEEPNKK
ncbi:hypothetical protein [Amphritea sp. HPY]|uniref:hypothetical protein n=1 Tax=Amphritea sp. HPY TaxID=3421652 RepID=UPI003D7EC3B9